jgi:hypothetical protein
MSVVDVLYYVLSVAALATGALCVARAWREYPERVTARGLAGGAALIAVSGLLAGYLLTLAQPVPVRVVLVVYAGVSVLGAAAFAVLAVVRALRPAEPKARR